MKKVIKKILLVLGIGFIFMSATLCLLSNVILFIYTIYNRFTTKNKKLNMCILLYTFQLMAYYSELTSTLNYFNSPYAIAELVGFNWLGIWATCILYKNVKGTDKNE